MVLILAIKAMFTGKYKVRITYLRYTVRITYLRYKVRITY